MTTRPGELIAVDGSAFSLDEAALKRLTLLFHRIAVPTLAVLRANTPFLTPEFAEARAELIEAGIFFEPDKSSAPPVHKETAALLMRDMDQILKPFTGLNTNEWIAARKDEKKLSELKNKSADVREKVTSGQVDPQTFFEDGPVDTQKMLEVQRRMSTNGTRVLTTQLRLGENLDAYAVIPAKFNSLDTEDDEDDSSTHDVMKIVLTSLPAPSDDVSWKQVYEYRSDPDSYNRFRDLKEWMSDTARGKLTAVEVREKLESLLDQYRRHFLFHQMNLVSATLEAFVVTTDDALRNLATVRWGMSQSMFSLQRRKVVLLEEESKSEGSVVAFAMETELFDFQG